MFARLRCLVTQHRTYRERRPLAGVSVLHFVCDRCGRAWPVMRRTPDEYREGAQSQLRPLRAHREPRKGEGEVLITLGLDSSAFTIEVEQFKQWLETTAARSRA